MVVWVKGKWVRVEQEKECPQCKTKYTTTDARSKFCSAKCRSYFNGVKFRKNNYGDNLEYYIKYILLSKNRPELSVEDILNLYEQQRGLCALSGVEMTYRTGVGRVKTNMSLDRIEAGGPYIKENVRLVCTHANTIRNDLTDEEMLWWCNKIIQNQNKD